MKSKQQELKDFMDFMEMDDEYHKYNWQKMNDIEIDKTIADIKAWAVKNNLAEYDTESGSSSNTWNNGYAYTPTDGFYPYRNLCRIARQKRIFAGADRPISDTKQTDWRLF